MSATRWMAFAALFYCHATWAQDCSKPLTVVNRINKDHIAPLELNDTLSSRVFDQLFITLDPERIIFTQNDITSVSAFRFKLDDDIAANRCDFTNRIQALYLSAVERTQQTIDSLLNRPFDFRQKEFWELQHGESFAKNRLELANRLKLMLKYDVLAYTNKLLLLKGIKETVEKTIQPFVVTAQEKVRKSMHDVFTQLVQEADIEHEFLVAIAHSFDPHTAYFSADEMTRFNEDLSSERLSFGIDVKESDFGEVTISRLVPGGPAWRSGLLHQGDLLVQLKWPDEEPIDLADYDAEEIDELFHSAGKVQGDVTVMKPSGELKTVMLVKEKIENTDNAVMSFVLRGESNIGYIQLPGFFTDESDKDLNGCANEVSKEIIKLNRQKIDGLILDLRSNGGGSLKEAIELAGIFVDNGPMAILESKQEPPVSLRDINKGVAYSGPLVIMVNRASASASELVAAALQDYKRAIIVGDRTFGKATGQGIFPLGENNDGEFVKITMHRIYRLTQGSIQQKGVTPDVLLPDPVSLVTPGEAGGKHALTTGTTTKKVVYTPWAQTDYSVALARSKERITTNAQLNSFEELRAIVSKPFPLSAADFLATTRKLQTLATQRNLADSPFEVIVNDQLVELSAYEKYVAESSANEIKGSPYIRETYLFFNDLLHPKK